MANILITEDDDAVRSFVARALEMDGHHIVTAVDGEHGFDCLQAENGEFDLLLSDIKMPFMDGIELAHAVSERWPEVRILMMTGFADQRERAEDLDAVIVDVVSKPFTLAEIRSQVRRALAFTPQDLRQSA